MALRSGGTTRAYNPETDIVYIPDKFFDHFMNRVRNHDASALTNKIRHVAISFTHTTIHVGFARDLACISSLETVSVVYPGPTGTFKHNTAVEIPADRGTPLRRLTEEELGRITINADYIYRTWAGDCPRI
ncbi:hypothetical protein NEMBOFW57_005515 [Staphylotrichum longicolle]|uniref:Uncharacterized protein n=1 Tax=Staphylotrichum longicolle TaxID=669026 RepID=A0AAD4EX68_9PEZI|nr:hypothetical protein NEMBOFW57_005515 [Staphylotrichum longicolle]